MLNLTLGGIRWRISLLFPALLTVLLILCPDGWTVDCLLASLIHEGGHLAAMLWLDCPPSAFTVSVFGARLEMGQTRLVGYGKNMVVSLAGPMANGVVAALLYGLGCGRAALVHAVLCVFHLLPVSALDGGQIGYCFLCRWVSERTAKRIMTAVSAILLFPLAGVAGYAVLSGKGNGTLLLVTAYLVGLFFVPWG